MDLILWRHAEAEEGEPDENRVLTVKGQKQAARMAAWLDRNLPNGCRILASPTVRTIQTVEALGRKFKIDTQLAPDTTPKKILAAANWPDNREPVLVVGHQPSLGQTAALLLSGHAQEWTIRKGAVWWISQRERGDDSGNYLKSVMAPDLVIK
jgi:phosphohistidine phosphatase